MSVRTGAIGPDLAKGLRAAMATVVPFYVATAWGRPELIWLALGGWLGSLADPGGTQATRAIAGAAFAVLGGAAVGLASSVAHEPWIAALVLGATAFVSSFARVVGGAAQPIGGMVLIATAIAVSTRSVGAASAALLFAAGAAWAALLSSTVWPVWPHLAVRRSVARVFAELAAYADATAALARDARRGDARWSDTARRHPRAVRATLEVARDAVIGTRSRRSGESHVGANLRDLVGSAESEFFVMIALAERLEASASIDRPAVARTLDELARVYRTIHDTLFPRRYVSGGPPVESGPRSTSLLAGRLLASSRVDLDLARHLDVGTAPSAERTRSDRMRSELAGALMAVRDAMSIRSPFFRHAIRVTCAATVAFAAGRWLSPHHVPWVTVTAIAVLEPYPGVTMTRAAERFIGTVFGGVVAVAVMSTLHSPLALAAVMFPLSGAAVVTRPRSYRLFVLFLTPVFVLVADSMHGQWGTAAERIGDVALGGAIALAAVAVFPSWERTRLADTLARAARAASRYAKLSFDVLEHGRAPQTRDRIVAARREVGVTLGEAETSLERMLAEPRRVRRGSDDAVFLITYVRRLTSALTTLDELLLAKGESDLRASQSAVHGVRTYVEAVLDRLIGFITDGTTSVAPLPPAVPDALPATTRSLLDRVVHHARLLTQVDHAASPLVPAIAGRA
jgi:uncharacterized membrane protein YccC